jgi:putative flippase GtrA
LRLLIDVIGVNYLVVGYLVAPVALLFNFLSHRFWTFRDMGSSTGKTGVQGARYITLVAINAMMNMLLMYIFYGLLELPLLWARIVCTAIGVIWTFPVYRFWVYKPSEKYL